MQDRLHEHVTDKKGAVYKYRNDKLKIELLVYAPCKDKKSLIKVETERFHDYSTKYGDRTLNKMSIQKVERKEIHYKVELEKEKHLQERLRKLGITLRIKDDVVNKLLYYDGTVDGKRYKTKARYNKTPKEEAMSKLTKKQQQLIDELTTDFN